MATFSYVALKPDGTRLTGELDSRNRAEAIRQLDRQRLQPVSLAERGSGAPGPSASAGAVVSGPRTKINIRRADIIFFTEELSDLLEAGLQLESALKVIEERQERSSLKLVAASVRQQVRDGQSFSDALRHASASFGELYCSLVAAGEASGALPKILRRQADYLNVMGELRSRIVQALIYPSFVVGAGILLMVLFMSVLVPQLIELFQKTDRELPLLTRGLIGTSNFVSGYWWLILGVILGGYAIFVLVTRQPAGREWWDRTRLRIPLFGPVLRSGFLAQFCQTLANLVGNGLPLLNGLKLMERATGNVYLRHRIVKVSEIVADGGSLSRAMTRVGGFPDLFIDLVRVGEQTGDLATSLEKAANRYEKEMNRRIERITALIQPVVIVAIAIVVFIVIYSIITSIFQAVSSMRGGG